MKKLFRNGWREVRRWIREPLVIWRADNEWVVTTIEIQHWVPFFAFIFVLLWYIVDPTAVALMSTIMLGGALLTAFLWARTEARGVEGERRLRFAAMQVEMFPRKQLTPEYLRARQKADYDEWWPIVRELLVKLQKT